MNFAHMVEMILVEKKSKKARKKKKVLSGDKLIKRLPVGLWGVWGYGGDYSGGGEGDGGGGE